MSCLYMEKEQKRQYISGFMRCFYHMKRNWWNMKYDYYNRTGVFKLGYNLQAGVNDEYILHLGLYPNPTDTKTFIPFVNSYKERYDSYPAYPVADAGYGSYDNYMYCLENGMQLAMKYNYFQNKHYDKKFQKKKYHSMNFKENEEGYKVCPAGHAFDQYQYDSKNDRGEYLQIAQVYTTGKCKQCALKKECTKAKDERKLMRNTVGEEVFGVLKEDKKFSRFYRRGQENVETEMYLIAIGHNIRKYHAKKKRVKIS